MNEAVTGAEKAVLVHIDFRAAQFNEEFDEFIQLVESAALCIQQTLTGKRDVPNAKYFIGTGKLEELKNLLSVAEADVVIFNHALSPAQERNLERELTCRVIDRVGLILDIFAQRAKSHEGKLQVELAQLQYLSSRLVRVWTHLERQKGGIGLRGPGETQLETDRRLIGKRIKTINSRLRKVSQQRRQGRRLRKRTMTPLVSLVGYTNAGKSTLFNSLTGASVYAVDKLFATVDTTLRKLNIGPGQTLILSDTVGFIRHIPHDLINAFHATLDEIKEADLLLHVIDVNDEERSSHMQQVDKVIDEIGAATVPQILVFNKIDQSPDMTTRVEQYPDETPSIWLSAASGDGLEQLKALICSHVAPLRQQHILRIPISASKLRASLFTYGTVSEEHLDEIGGWVMHINIDAASLEKLCRDHDLDASLLQ
ncbi:MAG: GTPase HflX [Gammaproteobacteria bacterium]|nr:GTPase HflX [Gammaproteobacteria bacterium]